MARWKLTEPHYLNAPDSRWEQTAIDSRTGKPTRKMFKVPLHLDPRVADDWNVKFPNNEMDGEIHVCWPGKGNPRDIVFEGDPTPGMVPLDDEAREVTAKFKWIPTQGIDEESQRAGFYARLGDELITSLTDLRATTALQPSATHGLDKMMEAMAAVMAQNAQLIAIMTGKAPMESLAAVAVTSAPEPAQDEFDRIVRESGETKHAEFEDELPTAEPTEEELAEAAEAARAREAESRLRARKTVVERRI